MSVRVEIEGEPDVRLSATMPSLRRIPRFALFDDGRHLFPQSAYVEALARANRLRWCTLRTLGDYIYGVILTKRKPIAPGFYTPVAQVTFRLRPLKSCLSGSFPNKDLADE